MKNKVILGTFILILVLAAALFLLYALPQNAVYGTVSGTITYGPTYPGPCREGMDCRDKPYNGTVYIKSGDGSAIIEELKTDSLGGFSIQIRPGGYFLEVGQRFIGVCGRNFVVEKDKTTILNVSCDTGMR